MYVGMVLGHVVYHMCYLLVVSYEDGYLVVGHSGTAQLADSGGHFAAHGVGLCFVFLVLHVLHTHVTAFVFSSPFLFHIAVGLYEWSSLFLPEEFCEQFIAFGK